MISRNHIIRTFFDIRKTLTIAVKDTRFFPRDGKTFCGQLVSSTLYENGYNVEQILIPGTKSIRHKINYTNTSRMYDIVIGNNGNGVRIISPLSAHHMARRTLVIVLSKYNEPYNHAAFVFPVITPYNNQKGSKISQAGGVCGTMNISDDNAWGWKWKDPRIIYFYLT